MKKLIPVVFGFLLVLSPMALAQTDIEPGLFTPDQALYGLEVAGDNIAMSLRIRDPGDVAHKRASEAFVMGDEGNAEAYDRAMDNLETVTNRADERHQEGLDKAEQVLGQVDVPGEAERGIDEALGRIGDARERGPEDVGNRNGMP